VQDVFGAAGEAQAHGAVGGEAEEDAVEALAGAGTLDGHALAEGGQARFAGGAHRAARIVEERLVARFEAA